MAEDELVRRYHRLNGHGFEQILIVEDRGAWQAALRGIAKNGTWLND